MIYDALAPAMFAVLVVVLLLGFPVAFSLAAVGGVFAAIGVATGHFAPTFLTAIFFRIEGFFENDDLIAIPLLVFMGMILEGTGIAEDMLLALNALFGRRPGGLAYTVVIVGAVLSAITGFVSASVIAIGLIALPAMRRAGYDHRLAAGVVAAAGTLAQILPPSLVLIVLADQLGASLIDVYRGALLPAAVLIGLYFLFIAGITWWNPDLAPPADRAARRQSVAAFAGPVDAVIAAFLPLILVLMVLAALYFGIATPSEGGAIGVTGALLIAALRGRLTLRGLTQAVDIAGVLIACLMFLLFGSSFFSLVFRGLNGDLWIDAMFARLPAGPIGFLLFVNIGVFLLAFFLDFFEIAFIVLPLIAPEAHKTGIDMVWLTVLLAINLQTSFMHPPFGLALYNLRSVAPRTITTVEIYWGTVPFLLIQIAMIAILLLVPGLVTGGRQVLP